MSKKKYTFIAYNVGSLDFNDYPDLTKTIFFDEVGEKQCRFLKAADGVGVIIDNIIAWAIETRKGISLDGSLCFYKEQDNFIIGFRVENENNS